MRKYIALLTALCFGPILFAQSIYKFTFEDKVPDDQWKAEHGTFSLSDEHFIEGSRSLCWEIPAGNEAIFTVSFNSFKTASFAAVCYIYNLKPNSNILKVEFMDDANTVRKTANVSLNFKGWREFNRAYSKDFSSVLSVDISKIRFTLDNKNQEAQKLFFDNADFKATTDASRQPTDLMILDVNYLDASTSLLLQKFANPIDLETTEPTEEEIADLNKIKASYSLGPQTASAQALRTTRSYINSLNITRNPDGTVKGEVTPSGSSDLTTKFMQDDVARLEAIAYGSKNQESDKELFRNYLDYIIDQGYMYKFPRLTYSDYTTVRSVPNSLLNILPECTDEQIPEVLKMINWIIEYGIVYENPNELYKSMNSDYIYLYLGYLYSYALHQPDIKDAVREVKAVTRFINRSLQFTDGSYEVLKPDGTGFHHNAHFNGYMYAFNTWVDVIYPLMGTVYRLPQDGYNNLKHAAISYYIMCNKGGSGNYYANSLCGRHPFYGISNNLTAASFRKMIEIGGDITGKEIDEEMAAAYNYFISPNSYEVAERDFDGFYQFNYSPMGIYRKDNWVVTMRAPTTKFWGAEIYHSTNRFGRYQSHGTLEVMYDGEPANSGLPSKGEGWDWNVVPGTTTVHYTSWKEMMPNKSTSDRFDQYTKTKNFAGALAWNNYGIFASDFDQGDTWGSERFTPTNLEFRKSVFSFDGILVSMGTNIQSSGSYSNDMITATNLFQEVRSSKSGELILHGDIIEHGSTVITKDPDENFWLITPHGTGYYIPGGNDKIIIKHEDHETPEHTGGNLTTFTKVGAAKAYIDHGVKPTNKEYIFIVSPATDIAKMEQLASQVGSDGGELFQIEARNESLHALTFKNSGIKAYTFFEAVNKIDFGIVNAVGSEMLLMQRTMEDTRISFAITTPNLRPVDDGIKWLSSPTETTITVKGEWYGLRLPEEVTVNAPSNGETVVNIKLEYGQPVYFDLCPEGFVDSIEKTATENQIVLTVNSATKELLIGFNEAITGNAQLDLFSMDGMRWKSQLLPAGSQSIRVPLNKATRQGIQIAKITTADGITKMFKFLF